MSTKLADDDQTKHAKEGVERDKKVAERSRAEYAQRMKGKPTPTQEENDLAMHGAHILEHEADGSDPDPNDPVHNKESTAGAKPAHYATRQTKAE
jgi:hypothetical protein